MKNSFANIPQRHVGPIQLRTPDWQDEITAPLATFESPLWTSVNRGAKVTRLSGGIFAHLISESMTRSILLEANSFEHALSIKTFLNESADAIKNIVAGTSQYATYQHHNIELVGKLIYLRLAIHPGQASGHNMATKAADALGAWIQSEHPDCQFLSVSANLCCDKKVSVVNALQGRGKHVIAETIIPKAICEKILRTTPDQMASLHVKKNLMGSILAGSIRTANAHFANMLLAIYLATGQDAANIVEGSQGITHADVTPQGDLNFSVSLPNIIVGTVGNGKAIPYVIENLKTLKCLDENGQLLPNSSQRLALITAATVLCGELSLMAAQTNCGELTRSHMILERKGGK